MSAVKSKKSFKGFIFALVLASLVVWVAFFDSHSIVGRLKWSSEIEELKKENAELSRQIQELKELIETPVTDAQIEELARTQYGMSKEGEVIYKVEKEEE